MIWDGKAFDRWLTTQPEDTCMHGDDECCCPGMCECDCEGCVSAFLAAVKTDTEGDES